MSSKWGFALVALLAVGAVLGAECVVRQRVQQAVQQVNQQAKVFVPAVQLVPAYGASYDASAAEVPALKEQLADHKARLALLEGARDSLLARVAALENKVGVAQPTTPPAPAQLGKPKPTAKVDTQGKGLPALLARSCIKCHQAGSSPRGGLTLVNEDGSGAALSIEQRLESVRRINLQDSDPEVMPPAPAKGKPLSEVDKRAFDKASDSEAAEALEYFTKRK